MNRQAISTRHMEKTLRYIDMRYRLHVCTKNIETYRHAISTRHMDKIFKYIDMQYQLDLWTRNSNI